MELNIRESAGVSIVEAKGRLDSATAKHFGERVDELVRSGANRLVVDLSQIAYISSAGFRVLLIADRQIEQSKGRLALAGVTGEVKRLFDIAAFTDLFLICASTEEGVQKVEGASA